MLGDDALEARRAPHQLPRFALLAQAIAGRQVAVIGTDEVRGYTDGEFIFLPETTAATMAASLAVQASLLAAGSLAPSVMAKLAGRRTLRLRYLTLEAARGAGALDGAFPRRVAAAIAEVYAGPLPTDPEQSLRWAGEPRRAVPEAPEWLGTIKPIKIMRRNTWGVGGKPGDRDVAGTSLEQEVRELKDEEESERSRILELFSAPIRNPLASMIRKFSGMGRAPGEGGGGEELPVGGTTAGPVGTNARAAQAQSGMLLDLSAVPVGRRYPEWDFRSRRYRPDWCSVAEFDPAAPEETPALTPTHDRRLLRQLARLGLTQERHRHQGEGDVLDPTALVELLSDLAAGHSGDPRVYETMRRTAHDLGVLILLDATGSTDESAEGRRVFDEQRVLTARLTAALEDLGDRVATYGFYSQGRDAVRFLRVKEFDDRFDSAAQHRLAAIAPGGFTRLGAAIRHGTHLLSTHAGTSMMLLVVVGDGLPYEDGYEHRYAQADSRRALVEAVAAGVGCACLSVRTTTEDEILERVWGGVPHRRLEEPASLEHHVLPLFAEAMRAARASRRTGHRRGICR